MWRIPLSHEAIDETAKAKVDHILVPWMRWGTGPGKSPEDHGGKACRFGNRQVENMCSNRCVCFFLMIVSDLFSHIYIICISHDITKQGRVYVAQRWSNLEQRKTAIFYKETRLETMKDWWIVHVGLPYVSYFDQPGGYDHYQLVNHCNHYLILLVNQKWLWSLSIIVIIIIINQLWLSLLLSL